MKRRYQIKKNQAIASLEQMTREREEPLQVPVALTDVAELAKQGLGHLARELTRIFIQQVFQAEVAHLVGERSKENPERQAYRWGTEEGYCIIDGQKVAIPRPRVRTRKGR